MEISSAGARRPVRLPVAALVTPRTRGAESWLGVKVETIPVAPAAWTTPVLSMAREAAAVLTGKRKPDVSEEPEGLKAARNSGPWGAPEDTGKSADCVVPEIQTLPEGARAMAVAPSAAAPPRKVAHTRLVPVGLSLATKASGERTPERVV